MLLPSRILQPCAPISSPGTPQMLIFDYLPLEQISNCVLMVALFVKKLGLKAPKNLESSIQNSLRKIANSDAHQASLDRNKLVTSNRQLVRLKGDEATKEEKADLEKYKECYKKKNKAVSKVLRRVNDREDVPDYEMARIEINKQKAHSPISNQKESRIRHEYATGEILSDEDAKI